MAWPKGSDRDYRRGDCIGFFLRFFSFSCGLPGKQRDELHFEAEINAKFCVWSAYSETEVRKYE
jgi:hypothetical protein